MVILSICFVFSPLVKLLRKILFPFALIYSFITIVRNWLYDKNIFKVSRFKLPIILVGNLSVGGTGKSPQIEYLIRLLRPNKKVAVLSRGYKRASKGFVLANDESTAELIGDEPYQFFRKFKNIIVGVDANRVHGVQQLLELNRSPDVVLLDDAYQHRRIKAGLTILLTAYNDLFVDDYLLPSGNLRENKSGAKRAQVIIVTKCPENLSEATQLKIVSKLNSEKGQQVFFTTVAYNTKLQGSINEIDIEKLKGETVVLVTGIANPVPLTNYLKQREIKFVHLKYPDHHHFTAKDIAHIEDARKNLVSKNKIVLTTEKDYVRIFAKLKNLYFIEIETKFLDDTNKFDNIVNAYVEQSSGNS